MKNPVPARIQLLQSQVVDQIAAGEVVDRPAHLVKELIENSLDAGATSIEVEYDQGGRRVRVTDNGAGIAPEELTLALARHATSKITESQDLWRLSSFGFRGEALASIAAVSRLILQSRQPTADMAHKVSSEFGKIEVPVASSGNPGTTITIEELFANVPARLKFMKSEAGEGAQIKATLRALALANEGVEFRVRTKGKLEYVWPKAANFLERAKAVLSVGELFHAEGAYESVKAEIAFASPGEVTGNARGIQVFVQKRWVQDRGLQAAVVEAYRGLLMHGEYPIAVVRLSLPPEDVDVNIHPTKSQVKFRDQQAAFRAVNRVLREAIEKAPWLKSAPPAASLNASVASLASVASAAIAETSPVTPPRRLSVADLTRPYEKGHDSQDVVPADADVPIFAAAPLHSTARFEAPEFQSIQFRQIADAAPSKTEIPAAISSSGAPAKALGPWSRLQVIGQANLTYILAQESDRLVLIDQHAAHERVAYERLMRAWKGGQIEIQSFLLPLNFEMEADAVEALMSVQDELEKLGVSIDQVGPQAVAVRSRPALISDSVLPSALEKLAREVLERGGSFALEKKVGDLCATMACHSVVRAGQALSVEQMRSLLEQMDEFPLSSFCPHGRPVSVEYPFAKLERDFGRIV